jgi:hypothetical protein
VELLEEVPPALAASAWKTPGDPCRPPPTTSPPPLSTPPEAAIGIKVTKASPPLSPPPTTSPLPPATPPAVVGKTVNKAIAVATPPESNTMAASAPRPTTSNASRALRQMASEKEAEIDEIKALTMHRMIDESGEGSNTKRLVFFTNHQASLFNLELIPMVLAAFDFPKPKLVITFLPCAGGSHTINHGMLSGFKKLKANSPTFTEDWKALLLTQVLNDPSTNRPDVLPIAPFFSVQDLLNAEWKLECFMRDVLVPLAAETNALIIGSAFKNDSLTMMFARVAASLDSKYGGLSRHSLSMVLYTATLCSR